MPVTTPDSIPYPDVSAPQNQPAYTGAMAQGVQNALNARQRYTYVWPNAAGRTAQVGMVQGSLGYQVDTKTEYFYDNGAWRLATPHIEFTASKSINNAATTTAGVFTMDTNLSTATDIATGTTDGVITVTNPGLYAVSTFSSTTDGTAMTGRGFLDLASTANDNGIIQRVSINVGENAGSLSMPNLRITNAGFTLYFKIFQTTGATRTMGTRVRLTRIG